MADWRSTPSGDPLVDYINQQIALGRIGGSAGTPLVNPPDPHDWRTPATQFDGLCDYINQQIALGKLSSIPAAVSVGLAALPTDWRAAASRSGDPLCDYINQQIALGRITGGAPPGPPNPSQLPFWHNAKNIDGSNNSTLIDGQALGTWKNLGTLGATGDVVQASASSKPTFRLIAVPGKLGNNSAVECVDAARVMITGAFTAIPQPYQLAYVFRGTMAANQIPVNGSGTSPQIFTSAAGHLMVNAGSGAIDTGLIASANTFHSVVIDFNGAASVARLDGVASSPFNPGATGLTAFYQLCGIGSLGLIGFLPEVLAYSTPQVPSDVETYLRSNWGVSFPN